MHPMSKHTCLLLCIAALWLGGCGHKLDGPGPKEGPPVNIDPQGVCMEQLTTPVTLRGGGLSPLPINVMQDNAQLALPTVELVPAKDLTGAATSGAAVTIPDDPASPQSSHVRWINQQEMRFDVFPELSLTPGLYSVRVANANGQEALWSEALLAVPRPEIEKVDPDLLCSSKGGTFMITGKGFIHRGGDLPKVTATPRDGGGQAVELSVRLGDCSALPGTGGFESCTLLEVTVGQDQLPSGDVYRTYDIQVENPAPVGCHSTDTATLTMVPSPKLDVVDPEIVCTAQGDNTITLTGTGFLHVDQDTPTVGIGGRSYTATVSDCTSIPDPAKPTESCKTLTITIPKGDLGEGVHAVVVQNPAPADCISSESVNLAVVPPPKVDSVAPGVVCDNDADTTITIKGTGFLTIGDGATTSVPRVEIGSITPTATASDCTPISGLVSTVETCTTLTVTVPKKALPLGTYTLTVTNPAPADCSTEATIEIKVVTPPTLTGVVPTKLCVGGGTIAVTGTGFVDGLIVSVGGHPADVVVVTSSTQASATFSSLPLTGAGPFDVSVSYSSSCVATLTGAMTIVPGPQLFFADPPVIYNSITNQITLYGSGFAGALTAIRIRPAGTTATPTSLTFTQDPTRPNQVQAVVPKGTAAGDYDVILDDQSNCDAILAAGLKVVDQVTLKLTSIVPPFGQTTGETAVTVYADSTVGGGFQAVPRLYLNPTTGTKAAAIEAVTFIDAGRVTAVVPTGLAVDTYDVIAVNPDGGVGLLAAAFKITSLPPPVVDNLSPGSISNTSNEKLVVTGKDFRTPKASVECMDKNGNKTTKALTVDSFTATSMNLTFDASAYTTGAVCVLRVTNDDGTWADFPGLVVTNTSQNLSTFQTGPTLATARRALASVGSRATTAARFIYAIGGDSGNTAGTLDTVEVAPVDIFGVPGAFFTQQHRLKIARSFAPAVTLGRCIYLAGGVSGTTVLGTVERACVLDPNERPRIADLDLDTSPTEGLATGLWYYRVSAVMGASDPSNPGGETLASEPFPVLLPAVPGRKVVVTVHWTVVPDAVGYRVYRSPTAGATADAVELLASISSASTVSYKDTGSATQTGGPLRLGATGTWHTLSSTLATARQGAGAAIAPDPADATGTKHYLYVMGGKAASQALSSIEQAPITINADGSQTVGAFSASTRTLSQARWQLGLFSVGNDNASLVELPKRYVYAGGGVATNGTTLVNEMEVFQVGSGGALGAPQSVNTLQPPRAGYGYAPANNFLYVFGGNQAKPDNTVTSAKVCGDASGMGACVAGLEDPLISNWNNALAKMIEFRYLMGLAVQSGYFYLMGGQTQNAAASTSTEYSNW